ncbi:hypothetical protein GTO87_02120 [Ligilactobacillus saerimneri]|uniref:Uncharacterized protein n=1 Tax=Ligilactobacillus saerimneri TaxID=228229 RepID=A0A7H9EII6_9LACO|nr:hypothetical protein GTO87_02120 [Ligilactobacillus saerimneri]
MSVLLGFTFLTGHGNKHVSADIISSETTNATASTLTVLTDQEVTLQNNDSTTPKDTTTTTDNNQLTKQTGLSSADNAGSNIFQDKDGNWYKVVFEDGQNKVYKVADITASANTGLPESWVRENIVIAKEDLGNGKTHWTIVFFPNKGFSKDGNVKGLQNAGFAFINSDKYVYGTQEDKDTYDQVAVEANKYLSRANGGYLDLNATQQLSQRVNDAWNALDGVKPTDSDKAADNAKYITHDQTVDWGHRHHRQVMRLK